MKPTVRRLLLAAVAVVLLGLLVWAFLPAAVPVDAGKVSRGAMRITVDEDGVTRIREKYVVSAPLSGRLQRIALHAGDPVAAGETLLAVIEPADPSLLDARARAEAQARVDGAESAVERASADLEAARARHDLASANLVRFRSLSESGHVSRGQLDQAVEEERASAGELKAARFAMQVAEFERTQARAALLHVLPDGAAGPESPRFSIRAPVDGTVLRVFLESSTIVKPGDALLEIGDPRDLEVRVDVLSQDAVRIAPGDRVLLEHWGGGEPLEARVRLVEPAAFTKVSALGVEEQRVRVLADLTSPRDRWEKLGDAYRVEARIVVWEGSDVLRVPSGALFRHGPSWAVFRIEKGRAVRRPVDVGRDNGIEAEVLGGLDEGDVVVLHPGDQVTDGARVRARSD